VEKALLPSGRSVPLMLSAAPDRPWEAWGEGEVFQVRRLRRGDSTAWEHYRANGVRPLELTRGDACFLADMLNARRRGGTRVG
jgi:hypothetical protein